MWLLPWWLWCGKAGEELGAVMAREERRKFLRTQFTRKLSKAQLVQQWLSLENISVVIEIDINLMGECRKDVTPRTGVTSV